MLRLKLQHFGHLIQRADSLEKTLMLGKSEDRRKEEKGMTEDEMVEWHHRLSGHEFEQARSWWRTGKPGMQRVGHNWAAEQQRCQWLNWPSREGNGTPFQYSCLENPMDGGAWWAAVHGVAKSRTRLSVFTFTHWRRKWQPTPVFLPGESQGQGSLMGCQLWDGTESDTTEAT